LQKNGEIAGMNAGTFYVIAAEVDFRNCTSTEVYLDEHIKH